MESLEEKIEFELKRFKFKRNSISYEYLIDAIKIVTKDKSTIKNFSKYVYTPIAKKYKTKPENVLWCMNKLINLMYYNTDEKIFEKYFYILEGEGISTKEFILGIARKIS